MASSTLKFAIVGCGAIGPTHAAALKQINGAELVAVADTVADRADKLAAVFGVAKAYSSVDALLADREIDVVSFCTPSGLHADHAVAAMEAGKHVVVEKPMDVSSAACSRMIAARDRTGQQLTVICQHRFDTATGVVRDAIQSGSLGKLVLADATVKWYRTQEYYDDGDWRGTWAMDGGGCLMNQGIHTLDLLLWLAGDVRSVYAQMRTAAHERIEVEDTITATLTFANDVIGSITATTAAFDGLPARIDMIGTHGSAVIEGDRLKLLKTIAGQNLSGEGAFAHAVSVAKGGTASVREAAAGRDASAEIGAIWGDAHRAQLTDFVNAIRENRSPLITAESARRSVATICAIYESARTGTIVHV